MSQWVHAANDLSDWESFTCESTHLSPSFVNQTTHLMLNVCVYMQLDKCVLSSLFHHKHIFFYLIALFLNFDILNSGKYDLFCCHTGDSHWLNCSAAKKRCRQHWLWKVWKDDLTVCLAGDCVSRGHTFSLPEHKLLTCFNWGLLVKHSLIFVHSFEQ